MADEEKRDNPEDEEEEDEAERLLKRFPDLPPVPDVPETPVLKPTLPPHPETMRQGKVEPGSYSKMAVAATAATSFILPIILFGVGGWWLDQRMKHEVAYLAFAGVVLGFIVGITSLMGTIKRLSD
jgi:hypothetical protein